MIKKGELIGRYRVESIIGSGGMSRVYKVKDMRVGTYLAMKEILLNPLIEHFRRRAKAARM